MSTQEWTHLVQLVDQLIGALRRARAEARRWRTRAVELEGTQGGDTRSQRLQEQARARELERYRRERQKINAAVEKLLEDVNDVQKRVLDQEGTG